MQQIALKAGNNTYIPDWIAPPLGRNSTVMDDFTDFTTSSSKSEVWILYSKVRNVSISAELPGKELSDDEMLMLSVKSGSFSFWDNQGEDVYNESDGTPLK